MAPRTETRREHWNRSAENYATFASQSRLYVDTATALVRRAGINRGMTVVDLACGTGVVTEALLEECPEPDVTVVAADFSTEMIALARQRIVSPRVAFHCEAAEHVSRIVPQPVDRVLCNAAFWQFDGDRVLAELAQVLKPGGKCLFTLPESIGLENPETLYEHNKLFWMVLEEMFIRNYTPRAKSPRPSAQAPVDLADARRYSTDALRVESVERIAVSATVQDYFDFLQIPVMFERFSLTSGVPERQLREILTVVRNQMEWVELTVPPQIWKIVVLERTDHDRSPVLPS